MYPRRRRLPRSARLLLAALAGIAALFLTHALTLRWAAHELPEATQRIRTLEADVRALGERLETAKAREKQSEQAAEVMRQANRLLREEESARQAELQQLRSELEFFQRLAGTSGSQSGLAVYDLQLSPSASPRVYGFVLTLTQNLRRSAITTGTVRLALEGTLNDSPVTLPWQRITEGDPPVPQFRFKYFEQLRGYLTLPEGFTPIRVAVSLDAKGQSKPVTRSFEWASLTRPR